MDECACRTDALGDVVHCRIHRAAPELLYALRAIVRALTVAGTESMTPAEACVLSIATDAITATWPAPAPVVHREEH